jgi:transcriptional regulator with XRE-family HTH domain
MSNTEMIDIASAAFARRLANLLRDRREIRGVTMRELARRSGGGFTARQLRAFEDGRAELHEQVVCEVAALYEAELADILPTRLPLRIDDRGREGAAVISTSGISAAFDPSNHDSLLVTYLLLVRQLRAQERAPFIDLRREDVEAIAEYLGEPGPTVMERLSTLMGVTQLQRRAMAGMFIAGAIVVGLAGSGVAALGAGSGSCAACIDHDGRGDGERRAWFARQRDATPAVPLAREPLLNEPLPRDEPLAGAPGMFAARAPIAVSDVVDLTVLAPAALRSLPRRRERHPPQRPGRPAETASTRHRATPPGPTRAPAGPRAQRRAGPAGGIAPSPVTSHPDPAIVSVIAPPVPPSSAGEAAPELTIPDLPYDLPTTTPTTRAPTPATTSPAGTTPAIPTATTIPDTSPTTTTPVTATPASATPATATPVTTTRVTTSHPPPTTPRDTTAATSGESAVDAAAPPPVPNAATGQPPVPPVDGTQREG